MSYEDEDFSILCKVLEEKSKDAEKIFSLFEQLDESSANNDVEDSNEIMPQNFHYIWTPGKRSDSELMWAVEEEVLYMSNGKIVGDNEEAYTCYLGGCNGRCRLKQNGIAYKVQEHTIDHGSMYKSFVEFQCRHHMREQVKIAGASKTISDIYEEAVTMYVDFWIISERV